ncbi:serine hydrolase domain-containing protein [Brevundimonas kwangchunensis]|uniref:Serine hydrolase domain-containing protein n=2 Tax=Brevundimonas kwangchunensis TaxID=322163 RepID=A0ABP3RN86_9CAUL
MLGRLIDSGEMAGAATLVWRGGVAACAIAGWQDREAGVPLARDSLFRIASLTKPVTAMAAMILMEQGRFRLDDPITDIAPEFADMRVLRSVDGALDDTAPAARAITFEDVLTHRAGFTYGAFHRGQLAQAYREALGGDIDSDRTPDDWIAGLASLPLVDHPGASFHYGHSTDLLGLLLARMEGVSLGELLHRRIFRPLGMLDTGFVVPEVKRDRRAGLYGYDAEGRLKRLDVAPGGATVAERPANMAYESGGAGLWSTLDDYLAFARVFLDRAAIDGARLIRPETLGLMTTNRLTDDQRARATTLGMPTFAPGNGFGLGLAVVTDPATAGVMHGKGGVGTVGWPGAYGGWWQADPTDGSVMILLQHNMVELEGLMKGHGLAGYGAIQQFHAMASAA